MKPDYLGVNDDLYIWVSGKAWVKIDGWKPNPQELAIAKVELALRAVKSSLKRDES